MEHNRVEPSRRGTKTRSSDVTSPVDPLPFTHFIYFSFLHEQMLTLKRTTRKGAHINSLVLKLKTNEKNGQGKDSMIRSTFVNGNFLVVV
jgi:hypothetical protein